MVNKKVDTKKVDKISFAAYVYYLANVTSCLLNADMG